MHWQTEGHSAGHEADYCRSEKNSSRAGSTVEYHRLVGRMQQSGSSWWKRVNGDTGDRNLTHE